MSYKLRYYARTVSTKIRSRIELFILEICVGVISFGFAFFSYKSGMIVGAIGAAFVGFSCVVAIFGTLIIASIEFFRRDNVQDKK